MSNVIKLAYKLRKNLDAVRETLDQPLPLQLQGTGPSVDEIRMLKQRLQDAQHLGALVNLLREIHAAEMHADAELIAMGAAPHERGGIYAEAIEAALQPFGGIRP